MSITSEQELQGISRISEIVATVLREMKLHARPGMSTLQLDAFGGRLLQQYGARSAPRETYHFPGWTCISVNNEIAHGIPSAKRILQEGDLVNIDVSAELNGFWSDNGSSFVLGKDVRNHQKLVRCSRDILLDSIHSIRPGMRLSEFGKRIEKQARNNGFKVIRNLAGHGVGRSLHETPSFILNCEDKGNRECFRNNMVVAIETFISTHSDYAEELNDGWTLVGNRGGFVAQHEHTILITAQKPVILTAANGL